MVEESNSEAYGKDLPRNPDLRQVEIIVDADNFASNPSKLMYYGTYRFEVRGGVGFHIQGSSPNEFFDVNILECSFEIKNPCFDADMKVVSIDTTSLI